MSHTLRSVRRFAAMSALAVAAASCVLVQGGPASADTSPPAGTPATVSADALPTWQVNGVVWRQVVVGNIAYATGSFTQARPPGVAVGGAGSVSANNIFAYDITTGNRVASFSHSLNGQGLDITKSPDGSRVYVVGDFTTVDGVAKGHIAAFNTATGALINSFSGSLSASVAAVTASNTTVWVGGNFFSANGASRTRLAALSATNGATLPWAPTADNNEVASMVLTPDGTRVIIGGKFTTINGAAARGMGSVDAVTGASRPWAANLRIDDSGNGAAINRLTTDGTKIYGSGYAFQTGNFEGSFAADPNTGNIIFANDCHGDTYDVAPIGGVLYTVSHAHDCRWIGSFPQTDADWSINMRHALAFTTDATGTGIGPDNYGWNFGGLGVSSLLQWFPEVAIGTYTGQNQAAWSVTGNASYVVMGGEFPRVNGAAQQGLVRFATRPLAPNKRGPEQANGAPVPTATSLAGGTARVVWQSAYDMDNTTLTYEVYRSGTTAPIATLNQNSNYWTYPMMGYVDRAVTPGASYTYRIKAIDPLGNSLFLPTTSAVTVQAGTPSQYSRDVIDSGAVSYWRLGEASGSTVLDYAGFNDATAGSGVTRGAAGAITGDPDKASTFSGTSTGTVASGAASVTPDFSVEAWIKTNSSRGGKIVGYGSSATGSSSSYDRHLYLDNTGRVIFGVYQNASRTLVSPATYRDNNWHHVVGTLSSTEGMTLYVDGKKVGADPTTKTAQAYSGYWRIGGDNLNSWPNKPTSNYLSGQIDDVAVYPTALALSVVQQHYVDSGRTLDQGPNVLPTAAFTFTTTGSKVAFNGTTSNDPDGTISSYAWNFGDGTDTGATPTHTFAADGTYQVTLTVTDNRGGTGTVTRAVTVVNQAPQAAFTSNSNQLALSVDGSGSTDADGTVASYAWSWGDGMPNGTGVTATHAYASTGTYTVTLTVTDNRGKTGTLAKSVTVTGNKSPVAAFTNTVDELAVSVDGSTSADPDGQVSSYAWSWGDSTPNGSGVTTSHTYGAAGTYTITLTVTDNSGATGTSSRQVSVAPTAFLARDTFNRAVTGAWGTADTGGAWTPSGNSANYGVAAGAGTIRMAAAGAGPAIGLGSVASTSTDLKVTVSTDKAATGGGIFLTVQPRVVANGDNYYGEVLLQADGTVALTVGRVVGGAETALVRQDVAGLDVTAGTQLTVRVQAFGAGSTTVRAKVWATGSPEPGAWTVSAVDSTAGLQSAGGIGLAAYLSGSATNAPILSSWRDLSAVPVG